MTTATVLLDAAMMRQIHGELTAETPLEPEETRDLLECAVRDTVVAVDASGANLVLAVTDRTPTPIFEWDDIDAGVAELSDDCGIEREMGVVPVDRGGVNVASLLDAAIEERPGPSVSILRPISPLLQRRHLDGMTMRLRRDDVVLGPTTTSEWYAIGRGRDVSLGHIDTSPSLTGTALGVAEADVSIDLLPALPAITSVTGLAGTIALLEAYALAGRAVAPWTAQFLDDTELHSDLENPGVIRRA